MLVCDAVKLTNYITEMLNTNPELFSDNETLDEELNQVGLPV